MLKRWQRWMLEGLLVLAIVVAVQLWQSRGLAEGAAPPLPGVDLAAGQPTLVSFWATWCPSCRAEMGNLEALARSGRLVSVAIQSGDPAEVAKVLKQRGRDLPFIADPEGKIAADWKLRGVPTHFIVDGRGQVRFAVVGYATEWGLRARLWWVE